MLAELRRLTKLAWADKRLRYLVVGGGNTAFGYFVSLALYYSLSSLLHIVYISAIINVINISFSFVTYKILVFKTKGGWVREYLRCYVVYGASILLGIAITWLLVDILHVPFWLASGLVIACTVAISYVGHNKFSFAGTKKT